MHTSTLLGTKQTTAARTDERKHTHKKTKRKLTQFTDRLIGVRPSFPLPGVHHYRSCVDKVNEQLRRGETAAMPRLPVRVDVSASFEYRFCHREWPLCVQLWMTGAPTGEPLSSIMYLEFCLFRERNNKKNPRQLPNRLLIWRTVTPR